MAAWFDFSNVSTSVHASTKRTGHSSPALHSTSRLDLSSCTSYTYTVLVNICIDNNFHKPVNWCDFYRSVTLLNNAPLSTAR